MLHNQTEQQTSLLFTSAQQSAAAKGHLLGEFVSKQDAAMSITCCMKCGMRVFVEPASSNDSGGASISGDAVIASCDGNGERLVESRAWLLGEDRAALDQRLDQARKNLSPELAARFSYGQYDDEKPRVYSLDEMLALEWKLRAFPDEPISAQNPQYEDGVVELLTLVESQLLLPCTYQGPPISIGEEIAPPLEASNEEGYLYRGAFEWWCFKREKDSVAYPVDAADCVMADGSTGMSVAQIQLMRTAYPDEMTLKEELVLALLQRYVFGDGDSPPGNEADIKRVQSLTATLPQEAAPLARAYLAALNKDDEGALGWIERHFGYLKQTSPEPLNCQEWETLSYYFSSLNSSDNFWRGFAKLMQQFWPDSAIALYLRGIVTPDEEQAVECFVAALDQDPTYWVAARECGDHFARQRNWQASRRYYEQALEQTSAQNDASLQFRYAWCLGKLKEHQLSETHYRACLKLDENHLHARHSLGWALLQQDKNGEALAVFEDAIKRKESGAYPLRNKAKALAKLGRFSEAIVAWEAIVSTGRSGKRAREEIARLKGLLKKGSLPPAVSKIVEDDLSMDGSEADDSEEAIGEVVPEPRASQFLTEATSQRPVSAADREVVLEEMIERCIQRGETVFDRRLRMYGDGAGTAAEKRYGRQYVIPGIGRIDLLTVDVDSGEFVIIELKRGVSDEEVVHQLERYLDWGQHNRSLGGKGVKGIICVHSASSSLMRAAKGKGHIEVFHYALQLVRV